MTPQQRVCCGSAPVRSAVGAVAAMGCRGHAQLAPPRLQPERPAPLMTRDCFPYAEGLRWVAPAAAIHRQRTCPRSPPPEWRPSSRGFPRARCRGVHASGTDRRPAVVISSAVRPIDHPGFSLNCPPIPQQALSKGRCLMAWFAGTPHPTPCSWRVIHGRHRSNLRPAAAVG